MKRWITAIASSASIISLAFIVNIPIWLRIIIGVLGFVCLIVLCYSEFKSDTKNQRICHSDDEIQKAMMQIIRTPGKICIMSRDLSWVNDEIKDCIKRKKDVLIFAEKETELTLELASSGVRIKLYGKCNFEPKTRFTIIGYNRNNPQVAIANTQHTIRKNGALVHTIYETSANQSSQDEWINSLAIDMMNLCNAVGEEVKNVKSS